MNITERAIKRPISLLMILSAVILLGGVSLRNLPVELVPGSDLPAITVITSYPASPSEEIERLITRPLEYGLSTAPGIKEVFSYSSEGESKILLKLEQGQNLNVVAEEIQRRINLVREKLPAQASDPLVHKFDYTAEPVFWLYLTGTLDQKSLTELAENKIKPELEKVKGVASVNIIGGVNREIHVDIDVKNLEALNVRAYEIMESLKNNNAALPAGKTYQGTVQVAVQILGEFSSIDDIKNTIVTMRNGAPLFIKDLADVQDNQATASVIARVNRVPGLLLLVNKYPESNAVRVADGILKNVEIINGELAYAYLVPVIDNSEVIVNSMDSAEILLYFGILLAGVVVLFYTRNSRSTLIILLVPILSVFAGYGALFLMNYSLNVFTFAGLMGSISISIFIATLVYRSSIMQVENGETMSDAVVRGCNEAYPVLKVIALIFIALMVSTIFMQGEAVRYFRQMMFVVSCSIIISIAASISLLPLLMVNFFGGISGILMSGAKQKGLAKLFLSLYKRIENSYGAVVSYALKHRGIIYIVAFALLAMGILLLPLIGIALNPDSQKGELRVTGEMPSGTSLQDTDKVIKEIEMMIRTKMPQASQIITIVGLYPRWNNKLPNAAEICIKLKPGEAHKEVLHKMAQMLRGELKKIPGLISQVRIPDRIFSGSVLNPGPSQLILEVSGADLKKSYLVARKIQNILSSVDGLEDSRIERMQVGSNQELVLDRQKAAIAGLSLSEAADTLHTYITGNTVTYYREQGKKYPVIMRIKESERKDLTQLLQLPLPSAEGKYVLVSTIASLNDSIRDISLERKNLNHIVPISAEILNRDTGSLTNELQARLKTLDVPEGIHLSYEDNYARLMQVFHDTGMGALVALALIYMIIASFYESFRTPFRIVIPLISAFIGVAIGLFLAGATFNLYSLVGMFLLAGIVMSLSAVRVNEMKRASTTSEMTMQERKVTAYMHQFSLQLVFAFTVLFTLLPLALSWSTELVLLSSFAITLISGLLASLLYMLFK